MEFNLKILIIESEVEMLRQYESALEEAGFSVTAVKNFDEALVKIEQLPFDAILMEPDGMMLTKIDTFFDEIKALKPEDSIVYFVAAHLPYSFGIESNLLDKKGSPRHQIKILTKPLLLVDIINAIKARVFGYKSRLDYAEGVNAAVIESIEEVLGFYLESDLELSEFAHKSSCKIDGNIMGTISLSSESVIGSLVIVFDKPFVHFLAKAMLEEPDLEEPSNDEMVDIISESCNQIGGLVKDKLNNMGLTVHIRIPKAIYGDNLCYVHPGSNIVGEISFGLKVSQKKGFRRLFKVSHSKNCVEFCFDRVG